MKLHILQELDLKTNKLFIYKIFYKEPTVKEIFELLTDKDYDTLSEEEKEKALNRMNLTLSNIELDLLQRSSIITESNIYYLHTLDLNNKKVLNNMNEEIKVLLCSDIATSCIVCVVIGRPSESDIPENDLNQIKNNYDPYRYESTEDALNCLLYNGENYLITDSGLRYEWDTINTKNIK